MKTTMKIIYAAFAAATLACFGLLPTAQAQAPCPTYCANGNTAVGGSALVNNTIGIENVAIGTNALFSNTAGNSNTATGFDALKGNTTGADNTANGVLALFGNTTGNYNTATGVNALYGNTTGIDNTATGYEALNSNQNGNYNTATGFEALFNNTTGTRNTANGVNALISNQTGTGNTAVGLNALYRTTGSYNVGLGAYAGQNLSTGSGNVCIGGVLGVAGESNTTRIGNIYASVASGRAVYVNSDNKIGTLSSSRRYKEEIKSMDKASEAILALKPVSFRYKKEIDAHSTKQFGLVAEEVEKVNPDLVTRDEEGKPETVRYEAVNAMLLNEFLKEHKKVEEQQATITQLKTELQATVTRQQKQIDALTAVVQKVSAQLEMSKGAPQTVLNNR